MSEDALKKLNDPQIIGLRCKGSAWRRALLSETPIPDAWMGLVVRPDGRRRFVPAGEDPRPEADDILVLVRNRAITLPLHIKQAPTASEHAVDGVVEVLLRVAPRDDELAAFHRGLLTESDLTLRRLADAVEQSGGSLAVRGFAGGQPAEKLVREDLRAGLLAHLQAELRRFLFVNGLVLERLGKVEFSSRSLNEQEALDREAARRVKELEARDLVERAALAATRRRLADLSEIFAKLRGAAEAGGLVQWHELLGALSPTERGRLLETLWRVTPDRHRTTAIVAVAGRECLWLAPSGQGLSRCTLPADLGGLRSARFCEAHNKVLIGAATGVWVLNPRDGAVVQRFSVPFTAAPQTGFNSAAIVGERLIATHSQLGCWSWSASGSGQPRCLLEPRSGRPSAIRSAAATSDGRVVFAADDRVLAWDGSESPPHELTAVDEVIQVLDVLENELFLGTKGGRLLRLKLSQPEDCWVLYRAAGALETVRARRWDDLVEVVIPGGSQGVLAVYERENVISQLVESAVPVRRAWASDDLVVALSELRDRLVILRAESSGRTGQEMPLARTLGGSIQDVCLVTQEAST